MGRGLLDHATILGSGTGGTPDIRIVETASHGEVDEAIVSDGERRGRDRDRDSGAGSGAAPARSQDGHGGVPEPERSDALPGGPGGGAPAAGRSPPGPEAPAQGGVPPALAGMSIQSDGLVSWGKTYMVSTLTAKEQCFLMFDELLKNQVKGLCVTNELPGRIFERYDTFVMKVLNNDPSIIMLSEEKETRGQCIHPVDTDGLIIKIRNFVAGHRNSVLLLDGLSAILMNNPTEAYKVGQFLMYLRKLMEENECIFFIPVHPELMNQTLFREILPLLQGAPNFHFVYEGNLRFDPEKITLVDNTLCESRLSIGRDSFTDMWHDLRGIVRLGIMPEKEFYILSDKKPIQDLNVKVLDGTTGKPLEFTPVGFEDTTMKLVINFPRPLKPGEEYRLIIEYRTTAFQAVGEDFYLHSVVRPIDEIKTIIGFPEGVRVEDIGKSDYHQAGDLKRSLTRFPSTDHHFSVSPDRREIIHMLKDTPERCMFRIIWNTVDTGQTTLNGT